MANDSSLRAQLVKLLDSPDAHASFDAAVKEFPPKFRGVVPERWDTPHGNWSSIFASPKRTSSSSPSARAITR